jgi:D-glycero-D-manno-heptose 1,7-bisphosphate phosphatase
VSFAVFLDRDGTIVADKHFLADPDRLELLPHAAEGLRELHRLGARLVVVTNQSGVGRGYFAEDVVDAMNDRLRTLLAADGVELDGIYVCPHSPDDGCECRKPRSGLFLRAAEDLDVDLAESFVIGDRDVDVEAGRRIGAVPIRIGRAPGDAADLLAAAQQIASLRG